MHQILRREVLNCFKRLHRARLKVFEGDLDALRAAREKVNFEFLKNKHVVHEEEIKKLIQFSKEAEEFLITHVVQAIKNERGIYVKLRKELAFSDEDLKNLKNLQASEKTTVNK